MLKENEKLLIYLTISFYAIKVFCYSWVFFHVIDNLVELYFISKYDLMLCILTSKQVLCIFFAGRNPHFQCLNKFFPIFLSQTGKKKSVLSAQGRDLGCSVCC